MNRKPMEEPLLQAMETELDGQIYAGALGAVKNSELRAEGKNIWTRRAGTHKSYASCV